ncbi:nuclear transport factor 2 family protein [Mycolicibacterium sp. P9-22]|nr:nuclear transport factor 2 family protein [Mycolicibacterium sp. P9-22]
MVARHVVHEVDGAIPELMGTLEPTPVYHFWGATQPRSADGAQAVEDHYRSLIATGKNRLEFHISRVVTDDRHVVTEGDFHFVYSGAQVDDLPTVPALPVDPSGWYLVAMHCLIVWPISENGLIEGEDVFAGEWPRILRAIDPGELSHMGLPSRSA